MKTITLEEHFTTPKLQAATDAHQQGPQNPFVAKTADQLGDLGDRRLADMDAASIDLQVLSLNVIFVADALAPSEVTDICRDANDIAAAAVRAHPTRFAAFANLALEEPERAADEFKRCVQELGFKGALVSGTVQGKFLDDPRFTPLFQTAQNLNVPIYLHPAPPPQPVIDAYYSGLPSALGQILSTAGWGWHVETGLHVLRLIAGGVFDRFPDLQLIIGHMGEDLPFSIARADSVLARSQPPLQRKPSDVLQSNVSITTSGYFTQPPFLCALQVVGADRLLFSVDYPYSQNTDGRAFLDSLPISAADKAKIAGGNAERLLKL